MILANFFNIKSTNGLYFYGLDYTKENLDLVRKILVRPELESRVKTALPDIEIVTCSISRYLKEIMLAHWHGDLLFMPTSHPLPFIHRQWVVLHDAYPFEVGAISSLKRLLLRWSLSLSRCRVGYINCSDAKPYLTKLGVPSKRQVFAPNKFPEPMRVTAGNDTATGSIRVGLLGTDSPKKNYARLFSAVQHVDPSSALIFYVYGHGTTYFTQVRAQFPDLQIELVKSDEKTLEEFMGSVDVLASAAEQEGFGRPIASALLCGLPVKLLDRPVFREFFNEGASFYSDVDLLARGLLLPLDKSTHTPYTPPAHVINAYVSANEEIRRLGSLSAK